MEQIRMPVLPDEIEQLAEAVIGGIDCRDCYVEKDGGGFKLSDAARQQIAAANEALAKYEAEEQAKLDALDAKIERFDGSARSLAASGAIRAALFQSGVAAKPMSLAVPYLSKTLQIEVDDSGEAVVSGAYGRQSVESAVTAWLASEEGQKFLPKQPAPGPFASVIRQMRRAH